MSKRWYASVPSPRARLAIISPLPPFPPYAGGTRHIYGAARHLAHYYATDVLALADDPGAVAWGELAAVCESVHAFSRSARQGGWFDPPAARMEASIALSEYMRSQWLVQPPQIVQFEYTTLAQYAPLAHAVGALVVCTAHVLGFVAQARRLQAAGSRRRLRRLAGLLSFWQYELRALRRCHLVVTLAESDRQVLQRWMPRQPVVTVPSGVDLAEWPARDRLEHEHTALFVGNYAHPPNVEGAHWLVGRVWPLVCRAVPDARLILAGRGPTPDIMALRSQNVEVPGTLDDLLPLYERASVGVAPIFWGSGVRIKLLEMMAAGLPIVATPMAADGLDLGRCALFAETPQAFADALIGLFGNRAWRRQLGDAGRATAEQQYDWKRIAARLAGLYEGLRAGMPVAGLREGEV